MATMEQWLASDTLDYVCFTGTANEAISLDDASKGIAVTIRARVPESGRETRPQIAKVSAANEEILGPLGTVSQGNPNLQGNVIRRGRAIMQAASAYSHNTDFRKSVVSTTTDGKVEAHTADAGQGDWMIVGGGNATRYGGDYYIVEKM